MGCAPGWCVVSPSGSVRRRPRRPTASPRTSSSSSRARSCDVPSAAPRSTRPGRSGRSPGPSTICCTSTALASACPPTPCGHVPSPTCSIATRCTACRWCLPGSGVPTSTQPAISWHRRCCGNPNCGACSSSAGECPATPPASPTTSLHCAPAASSPLFPSVCCCSGWPACPPRTSRSSPRWPLDAMSTSWRRCRRRRGGSASPARPRRSRQGRGSARPTPAPRWWRTDWRVPGPALRARRICCCVLPPSGRVPPSSRCPHRRRPSTTRRPCWRDCRPPYVPTSIRPAPRPRAVPTSVRGSLPTTTACSGTAVTASPARWRCCAMCCCDCSTLLLLRAVHRSNHATSPFCAPMWRPSPPSPRPCSAATGPVAPCRPCRCVLPTARCAPTSHCSTPWSPCSASPTADSEPAMCCRSLPVRLSVAGSGSPPSASAASSSGSMPCTSAGGSMPCSAPSTVCPPTTPLPPGRPASTSCSSVRRWPTPAPGSGLATPCHSAMWRATTSTWPATWPTTSIAWASPPRHCRSSSRSPSGARHCAPQRCSCARSTMPRVGTGTASRPNSPVSPPTPRREGYPAIAQCRPSRWRCCWPSVSPAGPGDPGSAPEPSPCRRSRPSAGCPIGSCVWSVSTPMPVAALRRPTTSRPRHRWWATAMRAARRGPSCSTPCWRRATTSSSAATGAICAPT